MEHLDYFTLIKVVKLINSSFFSKEEDFVVMQHLLKLLKAVIKEARHYLAAALFGLKQFKVKDIYQQILQKMSLRTGPKSYLVTVMVLYIKVQLRHH
jgi:hypothetical protein